VEVDVELGSVGEGVEDLLEVVELKGTRGQHDQCVVCVLNHWRAERRKQRVLQATVLMNDHPVKEVCHNEEQVRAQRIPLSQPLPALDPQFGDTVEHDRYLPGGQEGGHHGAPAITKAMRSKDDIKRGPGDGVECLAEVELEDDHGSAPLYGSMMFLPRMKPV
jgi:hypothetical protein